MIGYFVLVADIRSVRNRYRSRQGVVEFTTSRPPRSARSNSSPGSLRSVQCIPDNTITYTLQSPTRFWNIVDNKIGLRNIRLPLSLILWTTILLLWVATLVTHLLVELHAAHLGDRPLQGLLIAPSLKLDSGRRSVYLQNNLTAAPWVHCVLAGLNSNI